MAAKSPRQWGNPGGGGRSRSRSEQRRRILAATAELVAKRGYQGTSVQLIAERAKLSNKTFYTYFSNREECFLACIEEIAVVGGKRIESAIETEPDWVAKVRVGIATFLDFVVAEPARARTFLVESMGAGATALALYEEALTRFAVHLREGRALVRDGAMLPDILEDSLLGGLVWMVHRRLIAGEIDDVPALLPRMVKFVLAPYLGEERATEIAAASAPTAAPPRSSRSAPALLPPRVKQAPPQEGPERPVRMRPLRSGRGSIPAEIVTRDQRQRILAALVQTVAEHGYNQTTVAQITAAASVSRQTFYEHFESREGCFCAAYDTAIARIDAVVIEAVMAESSWPEQVAAALGTLLRFLAADPKLARLCFVEAPAVGEATAPQRDQDSERFVALLAAGRQQYAAAHDPGEGTEEALLGGVMTLITRRVLAGEADQLEYLGPELIEFTLAPYLGADDARRVAGDRTAPADSPI
jgi:AcrR family transcriptional regulator